MSAAAAPTTTITPLPTVRWRLVEVRYVARAQVAANVPATARPLGFVEANTKTPRGTERHDQRQQERLADPPLGDRQAGEDEPAAHHPRRHAHGQDRRRRSIRHQRCHQVVEPARVVVDVGTRRPQPGSIGGRRGAARRDRRPHDEAVERHAGDRRRDLDGPVVEAGRPRALHADVRGSQVAAPDAAEVEVVVGTRADR